MELLSEERVHVGMFVDLILDVSEDSFLVLTFSWEDDVSGTG